VKWLKWSAAAASTVLVLTLAFIWCSTEGDFLVWGTLGEWAGAVGSIAAAVVAVGIAIRDGRQREADRVDQQAAQARLLIVETEMTLAGAKIRITNRSMAPVFAVDIASVHVTPTPMRARFLDTHSWPRVDPDAVVAAEVTLWDAERDRLAQVDELEVVSADVAFVDVNGLRWQRWGNTPPRYAGAITKRMPPPALSTYEPRPNP
jgi:hypothetical protein